MLAMLGTDCSCQHCAQDIYLPRSLAPQGRTLPGSRDQATAGEMGQSRGPHLWVRHSAQIPGGQSLGSPHPPRVGRSVPGRQDWVGTRACLEPPPDERRSNGPTCGSTWCLSVGFAVLAGRAPVRISSVGVDEGSQALTSVHWLYRAPVSKLSWEDIHLFVG